MRLSAPLVALAVLALLPASTVAHAPSVIETTTPTPASAVLLADPTLSRAIGATIDRPGEVDWYRMDLTTGEPLVVGMTAPDTHGAVEATFTLVGPGLPEAGAVGREAGELATLAGVDGAVVFEPATQPPREVHGGLGFVNYGTIRLEAPEDGSYYIAVRAVEPEATGKYVLAPGVREEFGPDAVGGMVDLVGFFDGRWEPDADA